MEPRSWCKLDELSIVFNYKKQKLMKIEEAILAIENYDLEALVWTFDECPIEELKKLYVAKGNEELVVVTFRESKYIPYRLTFSEDPYERPDYVTLSLDEDYHLFILFSDEEMIDDKNDNNKLPENSIQKYINIIETSNLPGLIWDFASCPLEEIKNLEDELRIEKDGEIKKAVRCYVVLHKNASYIIPEIGMNELEEFDTEKNYKIAIPIFITDIID
jgi:hypothetical protein